MGAYKGADGRDIPMEPKGFPTMQWVVTIIGVGIIILYILIDFTSQTSENVFFDLNIPVFLLGLVILAIGVVTLASFYRG